jgi:hypothetical protein
VDSTDLLHQIHTRIEELQHRSAVLHSGGGVVDENYSDRKMREPTIANVFTVDPGRGIPLR